MLFVCAASPDGGAKLWLDGVASELVTGSCVRLQAGTGLAWCVLNEGDEELIFLEFAQVRSDFLSTSDPRRLLMLSMGTGYR